MKKFRFSLERVLEVRRLEEEKVRKEFAAIQAERQSCLGRIQGLGAQKAELAEYQRGLRMGGPQNGVEERWFSEKHADYVYQGLVQKKALREIEYRLEEKRKVLVQASKDRKVLEKLEENQRRDYMKAAEREEQAFLDEIAQHQEARRAFGGAGETASAHW